MCKVSAIISRRSCQSGLGGFYLDVLRIQLKAILLVDEELLDGLALVTLELDDLPHLRVRHNGAIASCRKGHQGQRTASFRR